VATRKLTGKQKAAVLLISMGPEFSAEVFKHLNEEEIEELTLEIAAFRKVTPEMTSSVLKEFQEIWVAHEYISQGGIQYAKDVLEKALGEQRAREIINRLTASLQVRPFEFARKADPMQIFNFIQNEHPQTIALVLSYLEPEQAAMILSSLPSEQQVDVARRIAKMESTSPDVIHSVERVLEQRLSTMANLDYEEVGGIQSVVSILNGVDRSTEKAILEGLELTEPELAEEIKKRMFVFEDIVTLDDRSIQRVIRDVDNADLQLALKVASDEVKEAIFRNMSSRMREMIQEEMSYMGPVRIRDVEEAQMRIVSVVRRLEEMGEIIISRGGGDEIVV